MSLSASVDDHELNLGVEVLGAALREGDLMADLTIRFLEAVGLVPPAAERRASPARFPREFLLELGFILRIHSWERAGLLGRIGPDLPPSRLALADLLARYGIGERPVGERPSAERLCNAVLRAALCRLAWAGRGELRADVALDAPADTGWLDALADFLWDNRRAGRAGG